MVITDVCFRLAKLETVLQKYKPITTDMKACEFTVLNILSSGAQCEELPPLEGMIESRISYMDVLPPYYRKRKKIKIHSTVDVKVFVF